MLTNGSRKRTPCATYAPMQRRLLLTKSTVLTLTAPIFHFSTTLCAKQTPAMPKNETPKRLVVFYSRAGQNYAAGEIVDLSVGNTERLARTLAEKIGADLYEIKTVKTYPVDYRETTEVAQKELDADVRPAILDELPDISTYDEIYLGYPIWWGRAPRVILTFVEHFDWTGKTIHLFCTHEGSGIGQSAAELRPKLKGALVHAELSLAGYRIVERESAVDRYLRK